MIVFALTMAAQAVPPPMPQSTADCGRPVYASDQLVCADPVLAAIDQDLHELMMLRAAPVGRWIEDPESWFRRSRLCAMKDDHRICLLQAYHERIAVMTVDPTAETSKACGRVSIANGPDNARMLRDGDGALLALGRPATPEWTPFVGISTERGRTVFRDTAGKVLARCRVDRSR